MTLLTNEDRRKMRVEINSRLIGKQVFLINKNCLAEVVEAKEDSLIVKNKVGVSFEVDLFDVRQ